MAGTSVLIKLVPILLLPILHSKQGMAGKYCYQLDSSETLAHFFQNYNKSDNTNDTHEVYKILSDVSLRFSEVTTFSTGFSIGSY